jgi:hypothetical protein
MSDRNAALHGSESASNGRVHITGNQNQIWFSLQADLLKTNHDSGGLFGMRSGRRVKKLNRCGHLQIGEKVIGHDGTIVLARMDDCVTDTVAIRLKRPMNRRNLHVVRPCSND